MNDKIKKQREKEKFAEEIVSEIESEFLRRQKERLYLERQWELNVNFLNGNQYCGLSERGDVFLEDKSFYWQKRGVFNHIAPIMETRLAKLALVSPTVYVRPRSDDDDDVTCASVAEKLIGETFKNSEMEKVVREVSSWSETCGTGFYKVLWNNQGGNKVGSMDGTDVFEGEAKIVAVSPFEIFPDNLCAKSVDDCLSVIQAKAVPVSLIKEKYGVNLAGKEIGVYGLSAKNSLKNASGKEATVKDAAVVIEYYEAPTEEYKNGRFITVAEGKLLFYGDLPYKLGKNGERGFPFVKQDASYFAGSFFSASVIERLIPVQRAYNAVKNRKHEFLNRLSNGVMMVEDGSVDVEELSEDGLSPGKILVYRQGSKIPEMMSEGVVPEGFSDEEERLINEFVIVSGVSDVSSSSQNAKLSSGSALELLIEQDNQRLTAPAEIMRNCRLELAKKVLRLYQQFLSGIKAVKSVDAFDKTKIYYADKKAVFSDDVYLESENELMYTPTQKKNVVLGLYKSGLLFDGEGKLSAYTKEKILSLLGYKDLDAKKGLSRLHEEKAQCENEVIRKKGMQPEEIDDHEVHIDEHVRYVLSEYDELTEKEKERLFSHVREHKKILKEQQED